MCSSHYNDAAANARRADVNMVVADDKDRVFAGAIVEGGGSRILSTCNALFLIDNTVGQGAKYLYVTGG